MKIENYEAKSLVRQGGVSIFSWAETYLNPYQGCYHNCVYCDGKSEQYYMHEDFGERIRVKTNAPELLIKFLKKQGFSSVHSKKQFSIIDYFPAFKKDAKSDSKPKSIITIGGGVCDVYQPAEKEAKMARKLLEIVYDYQLPLWILTKNKLVLRDIDLIKKINKESYACVNFTITLADERARKIFEPRASSSEERFEAIKILRKEGINSGIYFYPCLPFIGDTEENVSSIYQRAKEVNAQFVNCAGLTLKPGRSKNEFMNALRVNYPDIYPKYEQLYGNENKYGHLDYEQFKKLNLVWPEIKGYKYGYELGLSFVADRYVPDGRMATNLKIAELLLKISYIKRNVIHDSKFEIQDFNKASHLVENSTRDFGLLEDDEFSEISISKSVRSIIQEYVEQGKSSYLQKLEKKAYEQVMNKYYS
ncbi:MAG: radical SAM protein [Candidatus Heimdallarchaeaceae archaeon]